MTRFDLGDDVVVQDTAITWAWAGQKGTIRKIEFAGTGEVVYGIKLPEHPALLLVIASQLKEADGN